MKIVSRPDFLDLIQSRFRANPVVLLLGPRQCGKTTLARQFIKGLKAEYFDLESPADFRRLDQPMTALKSLRGWVVTDDLKSRLTPLCKPRSKK